MAATAGAAGGCTDCSTSNSTSTTSSSIDCCCRSSKWETKKNLSKRFFFVCFFCGSFFFDLPHLFYGHFWVASFFKFWDLVFFVFLICFFISLSHCARRFVFALFVLEQLAMCCITRLPCGKLKVEYVLHGVGFWMIIDIPFLYVSAKWEEDMRTRVQPVKRVGINCNRLLNRF